MKSELNNIDNNGKYTICYFCPNENDQIPNINYYGFDFLDYYVNTNSKIVNWNLKCTKHIFNKNGKNM